MKKHNLFFLVFILKCFTIEAQSSKRAFDTNDRIVYTGNSITHAGFYHSFIDTYYLLHYPNEKIITFNCGIGGNMASDVLNRMDTDILINTPTVATLKLGMNDVDRDLYNKEKPTQEQLIKRTERINQYKIDIEKIVKRFILNKVRVILISPSIYDQESDLQVENQFGVNDALKTCADFIKLLAKTYGCELVDFNGEMNKIQNNEIAKNKSFAIAGQDRIHPQIWGHFLMADIFLNALESPKPVSVLEIDNKEKGIANMENCSVSNLVFDNTGLIIEYLENSLPFPIQKDVKEAMPFSNFKLKYNQEILKISDLSSGKYQISIDELSLDTLSNEELGNGINLSEYPQTPQYKQAENIMNLYRKRHLLISEKLRSIKYLETTDLSQMKKPGDTEEIKMIFAEKIKNAIGKPWHQYIINVTDDYFKLKPQETKIIDQTEAILKEIYTKTKPQTHTIKIIKL
jgi:lysophospholipase L1-like esterase